MKLVVVFN